MTDVSELTTKAEFDAAVVSGRVVVDFARRHGCVPCQRLEPHLKMAANNSAMLDVTFYKVMLDEATGDLYSYVLDTLGLRSTPTVLEYDDGVLLGPVESRTAPLIIKELIR